MSVKNQIKKIWSKYTAPKGCKILVTGGMGYIGSHTVVELIEAGFEIYIVDNLSNSNLSVLNGIEKITGVRPVFENIDCTDYVAMDKFFMKYPGIKAVVHFAALKSVNDSVANPLSYYRNNVLSLVNVLELMTIHKVEGIVFSSSCTVYGQPEALPVKEDSPLQKATSPYGNTKQICEDIIRETVKSNPSLKSILLRYFNPIGAHPTALIGELPNGIPSNLLPFIAQTAAGLRKKVKIYGTDYDTPDGTCIRDFINVVDLSRAHVMALARILSQPMEEVEVYNIGTGKGLSVFEILHTFEEVNDLKIPYEIAPRREGDIEQVWADATKANTILKWKPQESLEDTLKSVWKWQMSLVEQPEDKVPKSRGIFGS